jgi:hypothetical protein
MTIAVVVCLAPPLFTQAGEDCLVCHEDRSLTMERRGREVSLFVDASLIARSPHADLGCDSCHAGFDAENLPHRGSIEPVNCMDCHGDAAEVHPFHAAMAGATGTDGDPGTSCKECHGTHGVERIDAPGSKFHGPRLVETCGQCHDEVTRHFRQSEHGKAFEAGSAGAPSCLSCHEEALTEARQGEGLASRKLDQEKICLSCHLDDPSVRARMVPDAGFIAAMARLCSLATGGPPTA